MQIPRSYIDNYSKALNVVSEQARIALVDALSKLDYNADIADIRNEVIAIMQVACGASTTMAARLAAEFYDGLRKRFVLDTAYIATVDSMRNPDATSEAVRAFIQILVDDEPVDDFIAKCSDRIDYETRMAANMCVYENAKHDPLKPKYARVPTGNETCAWCMLLASYGFTSQMKEVVQHTHENCDCRVVVSWDENPTVSDDDSEQFAYKDLYEEAEKMRTSGDMPEALKLRISEARDRRKLEKKNWTTLNELTIIARWLHPELS